ncbi:MAG: DUF370 domain-containing protein [Ruminococcaceae bacterium]|nr:DUF370 domain-containing protein [Oscillospiraceae bacterium]
MYLHIGNGITVKKKSVIGIFDLDSSTVSSVTKKYINKNEKDGNIIYGDSDLPRTFVLHEEITDGTKKYKIKLSRISSQGLKIRAESDEYNEN